MIFTWLERKKQQWIERFFVHARSGAARMWLATFAFIESIFFPIPTAAFFIPVLMGNREKWLSYAALVTAYSVLGGIIGYIVGFFFFDAFGAKIINFYSLQTEFNHVQELYNQSAFLVNFIGAFTPLPYKVFVLASGFLKANFIAFLFASIVGRGAQFFLIGYIMHRFGEGITRIVLRYFNIIVLILVAAVILYLLLF